jgi:hypothetical protein
MFLGLHGSEKANPDAKCHIRAYELLEFRGSLGGYEYQAAFQIETYGLEDVTVEMEFGEFPLRYHARKYHVLAVGR